MREFPYRTALIVGAGAGISASLARRLSSLGVAVVLAARNVAKLEGLLAETGARAYPADAGDPAAIATLFERVEAAIGDPDVVVFNAQARLRGPLTVLDPGAVAAAVHVGAVGGFFVAQQAARRMLRRGLGALFFTGATASVKGYAESAPFAMSKFALRALAESAARELGPKGIHVAHFLVDGVVRPAGRTDPVDRPDSTLDPDAIAQTYIDVLRQPRSAWSFEVDLRPCGERF